MTREELIESIKDRLSQLPDQELGLLLKYVDYLLYKHEDRELTKGIQKMAEESLTFKFLKGEDE